MSNGTCIRYFSCSILSSILQPNTTFWAHCSNIWAKSDAQANLDLTRFRIICAAQVYLAGGGQSRAKGFSQLSQVR